MRRPDQKIEALQRVWLFSTCSKKELRLIAGICDRVSIPAGEDVFSEDDVGREFYVIEEGAAVATSKGAVITRLTSGDFFGEMALLDGGPRSATVTTTEATDLIILRRGPFVALLTDEAPSVAFKMLAVLGSRLRVASAQLVEARTSLTSL